MTVSYPYKQIYFISVVLLLLCIVSGYSQTRSNPFEIKPRLKQLNIVDTIPISYENEVNKDSQIVKKENTITGENETIISDVFKNPFEVDHVPLRKSTLNREIDNKQQIGSSLVSNAFLFWFLIFTCALLAIVINTKGKSLNQLTKSIFNENMLKLFYREESSKTSTYLFILYFIYIINISVYLYLISGYFGGPRGINQLLIIIVIMTIVYLIRHLALSLFGNLFELTKNTDIYGFSIMIYNQFVGIFLIPINFIFAFGPHALQEIILWVSLIILGILLSLRTFRGIFIVSEFLSNRIFQIFIYLCAFEIAPILILVKTVIKYVY